MSAPSPIVSSDGAELSTPAVIPSGPTGYRAFRCPLCGGDNCGNDASAQWDVVTQKNVLLGEYDSVWCSQCGEMKSLEAYEITDPNEITAIDTERAALRRRNAADALFDAAQWALSALSDFKQARIKGYDAIAQRKLLDALALAQAGGGRSNDPA